MNAESLKGFTILKFVAYAYLVLIIVSGVVTGLSYGIRTGDYEPLIANTGGVLFASDNALYNTIMAYKETPVVSENSVVQTRYEESMRDSVLNYLIIMGIMIYLFYNIISFFFKYFSGSNIPVLAFLFAIILLVVFEIAWVAVVQHEFIIPFKGVASLFQNINIIFPISETGPTNSLDQLNIV